MKHAFFKMLRRITSSPLLNVAVGFIFLATGVVEAWEGVVDGIDGIGLGAHHGAILFGALHVLKNLPDLFEGLEYIQNSGE